MNLEPKGGIHEPVPFSLPHRKEVRASTECKKNSDPWSSSPELQQQTYKIHTFEYVTQCVWRHSAWFETAALEYMPEFIYILLGGCKLQSWIIYYCSQHLFHKLACQQCKCEACYCFGLRVTFASWRSKTCQAGIVQKCDKHLHLTWRLPLKNEIVHSAQSLMYTSRLY